eukprot:TRINITY_DN9136_c0_g1_i1.p1 TRINITY_DN9136_c0_g1~~TRINITY_DN9136_c0_g1_i1.p1  ORF type:complete len:121 (+),score=31.61 TRINITY_DN9136_c0_g1_i1:154-516(+)
MIESTKNSKQYRSFAEDYLVPTITQLAVNLDDEKQWKSLNYAVQQHTRSNDSSVRYVTLKTMMMTYQRLGEPYLVLLPETIPFLSELMSDSNAEVEKLANQFVKFLDSLLGEEKSISSYF